MPIKVLHQETKLKNSYLYGLPIIFVTILSVTLTVGWILNAARLFLDCDFKPAYKCEVGRTVGVFVPPVGGIIGYFTIGEENE